jgi:hypothetical protein
MMMSEIITKVQSLAENDQSIAASDITGWVDDAIQRINIALRTNFPTTGGNTTTLVPAFDPRFHEALVLFAVAKYRESDSDYQAGQYFTSLFDDMCKTMQRDMEIPPQYKMDGTIQQITVTDTTTMVYTLKMPYGSYFDNINVYQNNNLVDPLNYTINQRLKQIIFKNITFAVNDLITIDYELNSALNQPPYEWWENSGW